MRIYKADKETEKTKRNKYQASLLQNGQILNWKPSATQKGFARRWILELEPIAPPPKKFENFSHAINTTWGSEGRPSK